MLQHELKWGVVAQLCKISPCMYTCYQVDAWGGTRLLTLWSWVRAPRWAPAVGVLPSGSLRGILRRVVMSRDSPRPERDGARNTRI